MNHRSYRPHTVVATQHPDVSVVVPTYNRPERLIRSIESIRSQTVDDVEIVVVDDHSEVPVAEMIEEADLDDPWLSVYRHDSNQNAAAARNTGISNARGEWVAFLDDDDEWQPTKLDRQLDAVQGADAGAVYTGVEQCRDGATIATKRPDIEGEILPALLRRNFIGTTSTLLARRELLESIGGFDPELPSWQDWDLYLRLADQTGFRVVPAALTIQHSHDSNQMSDEYPTKRDVTVPRMREKHRSKAAVYGVEAEFEATLAAELGWSALDASEFSEARRHFYRSVKTHPTIERLAMMLVTVGGGRGLAVGRLAKQLLPRGYKFKRSRPW